MTSNPLPAWRLSLIDHLLSREAVIAYPTEGVWGLGCLPHSAAAVGRILQLKQRPWQAGLLLVAADIEQFAPYLAGLGDSQLQVLSSSWPGPVSYLVPDNGAAPGWIVGHHSTVGLRVSDHPLVRQICRVTGPLVSTSANITGRPSAQTALEVRRYFGAGIDLVVPGKLGGRSGPSEIKVLATGEQVR